MHRTIDTFTAKLLETGRLAPAALDRAVRVHQETGEPMCSVITSLGLMTERDLASALADFLELALASAGDFPATPVLDGILNPRFLKHNRVLPLEDRPDGVVVCTADPLDQTLTQAIAFATRKAPLLRVGCASDIDAAHERLYGEHVPSSDRGTLGNSADPDEGTTEDIERLKDVASDAPVIRLVNALIARAVEARASDIHVEPIDGRLRLRHRIDGVLQELEAPPANLSAAIVSRIKIMAKLNIAERRIAQDGRIRLAVRGKEIDFRVATNPTVHGESVALRILDRGTISLDFAALGFRARELDLLRGLIAQPHGILLVTGPTGSGKTTTLYAALTELNTTDRKVLTIEDPVEYQLRGINQVQVKPQIGVTFANALRSFLRQDPDVMMIGEIRDVETAQIAVQAALTGHLILSTLHTNDAASAVTRLLDMGVEDYLMTATINGIIGQRLVRTLCQHCREPYAPTPELVSRLGVSRIGIREAVTLYRALGCERCSRTGYFGRTTIAEILPMTDAVRQLVLKRASAAELEHAAASDGMESMFVNGLRKAMAGETTVEEILRATRDV